MAKPSLKYRIHEWMAERVSWIQYPGVSPDGAHMTFRWQMPWATRLMLVLLGCIGLIACVIAMFFIGMLAWAAITA